MNQVVTRYRVSAELHTDQGRNFDSQVFHELSYLLGIKKSKTTPFHLQSNDLVERQHQTLMNYLAKFVLENQRDWNRWIGMSFLAYRSARHETTVISPTELCFGRELRLSLDLPRGSPPQEEASTRENYVLSLKEKINVIHSKVREHLTIKSSKTKAF